MKHYDFIVVGAGIFGVTAALALRQRKYMVGLLNPGDIPHPLAASTDISKAVRMEYGADLEYMDMVEEAIDGWQAWNEQFGDTLYHEAGFLMLCKHEADRQTFEWSSYRNLIRKGYRPEHLDDAAIRQRFPAFASGAYREAFFNPRAGFAESGRVVRTLLAYAAELGVDVHPRHTASRFECTGGRLTAVHTLEGGRFDTGQAVVCAGAYTPYLLPELKPFMKSTGHPVFHIKPRRPDLFTIPNLPVFAADISNTGWYGFPLHPREGVVKIANHGIGLEIDPDHDERVVTAADMRAFREFLRENMPALAEDPVVFTRRCLYSDTLDGHFWIDRHPEITGLTVAAGGSGHALKMAPVLGDMIATVAEGGDHRWAARHRWRVLKPETRQVEEARYKKY
ncbi:MAG: FAD-dependent oxidoreductase [Saprospiraceae bacterium]